MTMKTKLGQVRGHGSARAGSGHWKVQRVTAIALVPLLLWFVSCLTMMLPAPYIMVYDWLRSPFTATMMVLLISALFYHGYLGVQVIIEDYIHEEGLKITLLLTAKFASIFVGLLAIMSILVVFLR